MSSDAFRPLFDHFVSRFGDVPLTRMNRAGEDFCFHLHECVDECKVLFDRLGTADAVFDKADAGTLFQFFIHGLNHLISARRVVLGNWADKVQGIEVIGDDDVTS